ncbi:hypothetical protein PCIT_a1624 [Pseudoalteromonas citrea]|uniref:Cadherin domain-containing protein n=2 Tax=Pseudoalteromonas citrea TaxID=43655 RepID=A0AAD4AMU6_9GAMM|nr:hypothetical protein [Pseudoalteromonas citrea]KAF7775434.1 hypothetical protein PCIT_a1624 [Pseudoalteromonas citrea]
MLANKKSLLALSVTAALTLTGCFSDDDNNVTVPPVEPTDPVVVAPDAPAELGLVINANVVDSVTTNVLNAKLSFLENGEAANNIVDVNGNELKVVDAANGNVVFTKKADSDITEVTVSVTADGYIGKSFIIDLTAAEGVSSVAAQLALTLANGAGVTTVAETVGAVGGATSTAVEAASSGKSGAGANIPAGTQLLDAAGNAISGELSLSVSGADSSSSAAAAIVPAGLNAADAASTAKSAGVANILMADANGNKVKSFGDSEITVTMAIPADTKKNGVAIKTGDTLKLKSHNEDTGVWSDEENVVTIGDLDAESNTFTGTFQTNHLTFFSSTVEIEACSSDISINVTGDAVPADGLYVQLASSDASANSYIAGGSTTTTLVSADNAKRFGISADATASVSIVDVNGNVWFSSNEEVEVCGAVTATLVNPVEQPVSENFTVTAACGDGQTVDVSNAVVTYGLAGKAQSIAASAGNGSFSLANMVPATTATYTVTVDARIPLDNGTTMATGPITVTPDGTAESIALRADCGDLTGGN